MGIVYDWFESYLYNRKQFVSIGGVSSGLLDVTCGVPQGSVLGPLLFLLYINDMKNTTSDLDIYLFGDDSNLFCSDKSLSRLETRVNAQLSEVYRWLCANRLSLNIEKSNYIIFHSVQRKLNYEIKVFLNNQILKREFSTTYLGVAIDCHLNWKSHVSNISKNVKRNIGAISKIRHFVSIDVLMNLYYSLIYPFLTYALVVWGNTYASSIDPLFILQKK
jgi:hypothetical protein